MNSGTKGIVTFPELTPTNGKAVLKFEEKLVQWRRGKSDGAGKAVWREREGARERERARERESECEREKERERERVSESARERDAHTTR